MNKRTKCWPNHFHFLFSYAKYKMFGNKTWQTAQVIPKQILYVSIMRINSVFWKTICLPKASKHKRTLTKNAFGQKMLLDFDKKMLFSWTRLHKMFPIAVRITFIFTITLKPQTLESQSRAPKMRVFTDFWFKKKYIAPSCGWSCGPDEAGQKDPNTTLLWRNPQKIPIPNYSTF